MQRLSSSPKNPKNLRQEQNQYLIPLSDAADPWRHGRHRIMELIAMII
jgi:hypothetical protein